MKTPTDAFYFDPDFRSKTHPRDPKAPYCIRCQQNLDTSKAIAVSFNDETWMAVVGHDRHEEIRTNLAPHLRGLVCNGWIGKDCYKKVMKK